MDPFEISFLKLKASWKITLKVKGKIEENFSEKPLTLGKFHTTFSTWQEEQGKGLFEIQFSSAKPK